MQNDPWKSNPFPLFSHACVAQLCLTLLRPHGLAPLPWNFLGENTGADYHFLLQGIVPNLGLNRHLLHWQRDSLPLSHLGIPCLVISPQFTILC